MLLVGTDGTCAFRGNPCHVGSGVMTAVMESALLFLFLLLIPVVVVVVAPTVMAALPPLLLLAKGGGCLEDFLAGAAVVVVVVRMPRLRRRARLSAKISMRRARRSWGFISTFLSSFASVVFTMVGYEEEEQRWIVIGGTPSSFLTTSSLVERNNESNPDVVLL